MTGCLTYSSNSVEFGAGVVCSFLWVTETRLGPLVRCRVLHTIPLPQSTLSLTAAASPQGVLAHIHCPPLPCFPLASLETPGALSPKDWGFLLLCRQSRALHPSLKLATLSGLSPYSRG